jgi:predicted flap endonuclease-1-like 5' DNA nuclease
MASIIKIEGIGPVYREKLVAYGIKTVESLLKQGASSAGRAKIAAGTGIADSLILEWVNHADLWRIKGVSEEYSDLLEEAGVDTVVELAQRVPQNLFNKMTEVNHLKHLVRRLPSQKQVEKWVAQAKMLPRVVTY